ncbi:DUF317 domain-containing protein [Streptomyces sp. NPDC090442]|uniref:DUF317 domain-containing protein n=1 Tax=Streptomyces sp. NPDC090442 TaxID=3365962 RepID=UPI00380536A8
MRAEFVHEAGPDDTQWRIAAYESPVGERLWHATASATVPVEIMRVLLDSLASEDAAKIAAGSQVSEATISEATRPLADVGWEHTVDRRWIRWHAPADDPSGVQFDAFAAQSPHSPLPAWTFWGGGAADTPGWTLHFSPHAAASVLQDVAFEVARGLTQRQLESRPRRLNALCRFRVSVSNGIAVTCGASAFRARVSERVPRNRVQSSPGLFRMAGGPQLLTASAICRAACAGVRCVVSMTSASPCSQVWAASA